MKKQFFICKRSRQLATQKVCEKRGPGIHCHDENGIGIHCVPCAEMASCRMYSIDEVFEKTCVDEFRVVYFCDDRLSK